MNEALTAQEVFEKAKADFIAQWGAMGSQWGINRTMAQIHALLMISPEPLTTDEVMAQLEISRGNAHGNLKELVAWGLLRVVIKRGERKEFFEAEKDVWQIFTIVTRERKKREIEPAMTMLSQCVSATEKLNLPEAKAFHDQVRQLEEFVSFASRVADKVASLKHGFAVQLAAKVFG
jgi:DNA-binding transcriptional regulator GbsR (MarR family)